MRDQNKTKTQLINELAQLRQRIAELEAADVARAQVEDALRESEARYRNIVELAPDGILTVSLLGVATSCNSAFLELTGYSRDEIVGAHISRFPTLRVEDIPKYTNLLVSIIRGKSLKPFEFIWAHKDGTERWGEAHVGLMKKGAKLIGLQLILRDVTERKQAEEERARLVVQIQEQAHRMQQIMDTVPEAVFLLDADAQIILANPVAERELLTLANVKVGDTLTGLGEYSLAEFLLSPPKGLWHEIAANDQVFQVIARPIENGTTAAGWVLVIRDVTQQREIQQHVQQQERLAAVGQLAAGIAHDFNNIMATIVLYAQMTARMEGLPAAVRERMATINENAEHATQLIQKILDFGRRAVLERRPIDLALLLEEHVTLLGRTLPDSITVRLDRGFEEAATPFTVNADPARMQQMLTNLVLNARDAMPRGGTLHIGWERTLVEPGASPLLPEMTPGAWIKVTVSDTGTGIPPDVLPHIFEPFFTTRSPLGSGLGLAQVHGIVGAHEGRIDVETQIGKGTTFTIYLPVYQLTSPSTQASLALPTLPTGEGEMILVVEDDAVVCQALVESLEMLNYQVRDVSNGQAALELLEKYAGEVDLVLSDVRSQMSGSALLHILRERGLMVPVVMLTGHSLKSEMEKLRAHGVTDWLPKPPELKQLAEVVARALSME